MTGPDFRSALDAVRLGSATTYQAMRLDEPGGYVTPRGMFREFSYLSDAAEWCERKKTEAA